MRKRNKSPNIGKRINELRFLLGDRDPVSAAWLGEKIGVTRSQIWSWESGKEWPSAERLIALGSMAPAPLSLWFWEQAGLNVEEVENAIRQKMRDRRGELALGEIVRIRRLDVATLMRERRPIKDKEEAESAAPDSIPFASLFIPQPSSTICIQVTERAKGPLVSAGDLALIQQKHDPLLLLEGRLVAVLFERQPNLLLPSPDAAASCGQGPLLGVVERERMRDEIERWEEDDLSKDKFLAEATEPGISFGFLRLGSDERWNRSRQTLGPEHPWRFYLDCGQDWKGLTDWSTGKLPSGRKSPKLKKGIEILGIVIGWIGASNVAVSGLASEDIEPETGGA
jgi:transcriptional regulator with XRE-family HTH domain